MATIPRLGFIAATVPFLRTMASLVEKLIHQLHVSREQKKSMTADERLALIRQNSNRPRSTSVICLPANEV